ncbi:MAG TPA: glycosyltransferase [Gemmatimonadaceae bacterium]|nr:glycosyltransferase [Gemmatimonadaceae bacterium]
MTVTADGVSVILIVRNGERFIGEALDSVRQQSLQPLEVLVIDGQSTDATVEIARAFPGVTIVPQRTLGIANAYNEGIALARGALIAFISHDDRWLPNKLEAQASFLARHPDVMLTVTHVQHVLEYGATPPAGFRVELLDQPVPGLIMETLVVRREVFDRVGLFDPSFPVGEDTDWFARVKDAGVRMAVLPETLVTKRVHGTNASLANPAINTLLLRALRSSIERKRAATTDA